MMLVSTSVIVVVQASKNGCHQHPYPQDYSQLPPASLAGSLGSASVSDPSSFQITASALDLGAYGILRAPKSEISVF